MDAEERERRVVLRAPSWRPSIVLFNHWYHHRGELVVYLRLLDVPVPSVYGPTADENPFESPQLTPRPETMGSPSGFVACCIDQAFTQRGLVAAWLGRLQAAGVADAKPPASEMLEHSQPLAVTIDVTRRKTIS